MQAVTPEEKLEFMYRGDQSFCILREYRMPDQYHMVADGHLVSSNLIGRPGAYSDPHGFVIYERGHGDGLKATSVEATVYDIGVLLSEHDADRDMLTETWFLAPPSHMLKIAWLWDMFGPIAQAGKKMECTIGHVLRHPKSRIQYTRAHAKTEQCVASAYQNKETYLTFIRREDGSSLLDGYDEKYLAEVNE